MHKPFLVLALLFAPSPAQAYIDPGTGSYAFQVIVATIAGSIYALSLYWKKFTGLFGGRKDPPEGDAAQKQDAPDDPPGGEADGGA